ncbi:MAG TPA: FdtA/QdtA family cupin domain-containing protein [Burkholderiaceae bacterium]|nr:FdtA/QdtA family cupin domain-containing protein [Burkholderiaceae bacterium]
MPLSDCRIIEMPRFTDDRGSLSVVESRIHVPFDVRRMYYLYDIPAGQVRAAHGHKRLQQLMIAVSGSFDVLLDDGFDRRRVRLDRPDRGLYIAPSMWRELDGFSGGAVCIVLASELYDENDYLRDYDDFVAFARRAR